LGQSQNQGCWYFLLFNANKKSITVNLKSERGLELIKNMAKCADVMAENLYPSGEDRGIAAGTGKAAAFTRQAWLDRSYSSGAAADRSSGRR